MVHDMEVTLALHIPVEGYVRYYRKEGTRKTKMQTLPYLVAVCILHYIDCLQRLEAMVIMALKARL